MWVHVRIARVSKADSAHSDPSRRLTREAARAGTVASDGDEALQRDRPEPQRGRRFARSVERQVHCKSQAIHQDRAINHTQRQIACELTLVRQIIHPILLRLIELR